MTHLNSETKDRMKVLASLKGAPLAILVAVLIAQGQPLTVEELQEATGYGRNAIQRGIQTLLGIRAIKKIGRGRYLLDDGSQMYLPIIFRLEGQPKDTLPGTEMHQKGAIPSTSDTEMHQNSAIENPPQDEMHQKGAIAEQEKAEMHQKGAAFAYPRARGRSTTTTTLSDQLNNETHSEEGDQSSSSSGSVAINDLPKADRIAIIAWLEEAGLSRGHPAVKELLSTPRPPDYAKAHILDFLARQKEDPNKYQPGLLVTKMRNDPAPPMRCDKCLKVRATDCRCAGGGALRNQIPEEYRDIIKH